MTRRRPLNRRMAMRVATFEGVMATVSEHLATPYLPLLALYWGASTSQIGLMTALPALLANLLQIPAAYLTERLGRRKTLCIIGIVAQRLPLMIVALIPFWFDGLEALIAFILLLSVRAALGSAAPPAWTSLMAEIIPRRLRGSYFSRRNALSNVAALGAAFGAAYFMRQFAQPTNFQIVYALAGGFGLLGAYAFLRFPDLDQREPGRVTTSYQVAAVWTRIKEEPRYRAYAWTSFLWGFGVTLPQPLFAVYFVDHLGGTAGLWGMLSASSIAATIIAQRYWGLRVSLLGDKRVMSVAGIFAGLIPAFWAISRGPMDAYVYNTISGFFWAGYHLAAFNMLLEVTPGVHRTALVAGYNALVGVSHFLGPLVGGVTAERLGIPAVFLISTALRLAGLAAFVMTVRIGPSPPFRLRDFLPLAAGRQRRRRRRRHRVHPSNRIKGVSS